MTTRSTYQTNERSTAQLILEAQIDQEHIRNKELTRFVTLLMSEEENFAMVQILAWIFNA
jgi:hypothetical protein